MRSKNSLCSTKKAVTNWQINVNDIIYMKPIDFNCNCYTNFKLKHKLK